MINEKMFQNNLKDYPEYVREKTLMIINEIIQVNNFCLDDKQSLIDISLDIAESICDREPVEFVVTTCPDYSYEIDELGKRYFTFDGINNGPGLVGLEALQNLMPVADIFNKYGVYMKITLAYADIEALDEDYQLTMNLSPAKYMEKIEQSIASMYLLARNYLRAITPQNSDNIKNVPNNPIDNFITIDSVKMSSRFLTSEHTDKAKCCMSILDSYAVTCVSYARRNVINRVFARHPNRYNQNENGESLSYKRAVKDITDHMAIGDAIASERKRKKKVILVSLSIPELAQYFEYRVKDTNDSSIIESQHIPIALIKSNY